MYAFDFLGKKIEPLRRGETNSSSLFFLEKEKKKKDPAFYFC